MTSWKIHDGGSAGMVASWKPPEPQDSNLRQGSKIEARLLSSERGWVIRDTLWRPSALAPPTFHVQRVFWLSMMVEAFLALTQSINCLRAISSMLYCFQWLNRNRASYNSRFFRELKPLNQDMKRRVFAKQHRWKRSFAERGLDWDVPRWLIMADMPFGGKGHRYGVILQEMLHSSGCFSNYLQVFLRHKALATLRLLSRVYSKFWQCWMISCRLGFNAFTVKNPFLGFHQPGHCICKAVCQGKHWDGHYTVLSRDY